MVYKMDGPENSSISSPNFIPVPFPVPLRVLLKIVTLLTFLIVFAPPPACEARPLGALDTVLGALTLDSAGSKSKSHSNHATEAPKFSESSKSKPKSSKTKTKNRKTKTATTPDSTEDSTEASDVSEEQGSAGRSHDRGSKSKSKSSKTKTRNRKTKTTTIPPSTDDTASSKEAVDDRPAGRSLDGGSKSKLKSDGATTTPTTTTPAPIPDPDSEKSRSNKIMQQFEKGDIKSIMEVPVVTSITTTTTPTPPTTEESTEPPIVSGGQGPSGRSLDGGSKSKSKSATATTIASMTPTPNPDPERDRSDKLMQQFEMGNMKSILEFHEATTIIATTINPTPPTGGSTEPPKVPEGPVGRSFDEKTDEKVAETTPKKTEPDTERASEGSTTSERSTTEAPEPTSITARDIPTRKHKMEVDYAEWIDKEMEKHSKQTPETKSQRFSEEVDSGGSAPNSDPEKERSDMIMKQFAKGDMKSLMEFPSFEGKHKEEPAKKKNSSVGGKEAEKGKRTEEDE